MRLNTRNRMTSKIIFFISIFLLFFAPKLFAANVTISDGSGNCDQSDTDVTIVEADTYTIDCSGANGWHVNSLIINGTVTHAASDYPGVIITSDNGITVNGSIDVVGKGYAGGRGLDNANSAEDGYTCDGCDGGGKKSKMSDVATEHYGAGGGGHGGVGGVAARASAGYGVGGESYDSALDPTMFGSGGGGGTSYGDNTLYDGGAGGGLVKLTAQTVTMKGSITANGAEGEGRTDGTCHTARIQGGGGGGGGTIVINTNTFECGTSCGSITAVGGQRGDHCTNYYDTYCCASEDASGGGGRIAIRFQTASTDDLATLIENLSANGFYANKKGETGTAILINTSTKDAYIKHGFDFQTADLFDDDAEDGYKDFKFDTNNDYRNLHVYMATLRLHTSTKVELDGDLISTGNTGQRNGGFSSINNYSYFACKDADYNLILNADTLTKANDARFRIYYSFPRAGTDSTLFPNQNYFCNNASVTFSESTNLAYDYYKCNGTMSIDLSANTGAINHDYLSIYAEDGVALQFGQNDTIGTASVISVTENMEHWVNITGTTFALDGIDRIEGNANIDVTTFVMDADSTINASGKGYAGGDLDNDGEDGYGFSCDACDGGGAPAYIKYPVTVTDDVFGAGGAGHGGAGGDADYNNNTTKGMGGDTYDSTSSPEYFGAGGGSGYRESTAYGATKHAHGGTGGGKVIITADSMTLAGAISAAGDAGQSGEDGAENYITNATAYGGGGGAGGMIYLHGGVVQCNGDDCPTLSIAGGAGGADYRHTYDTHMEPPGGSGGGGGGIIKVDYSSISGANQTSIQSAAVIAGGAGHETAGAGGVGVITFAQANEAPVADAGGPYASQQPGAISVLDGSDSSDGDDDSLTYSWTCTSCPQSGDNGFVNCNTSISLANPTTTTPSFTVYDHGNYVFQFSVSDSKTTITDNATVTVLNVIPAVAYTGLSNGLPGATINLTASISDSNNDSYSCIWRVETAPKRRYSENGNIYRYNSAVYNNSYVLSSNCSSSINLPTNLAVGDTFNMRFIVTDEHSASNYVDVPIVISNKAPAVSDTDAERTDYIRGTVSVTGSDDNMDELSYTFAKKDGAGSAPANATWTIDSETGAIRGNRVGTYKIMAEVCDENDSCIEEEVEFNVLNAPPVVVLEEDERVISRTDFDNANIGELFELEISDLNDDEDFVITPAQNSGPSDLYFDGSSLDTSRRYKKGSYQGRYLVTDGTNYDNNSAYSDNWSIVLPNNAPTVDDESAEDLENNDGTYSSPAFRQTLTFDVEPSDFDGDNLASSWTIYDALGEELRAGFTQTSTNRAVLAFNKPGTYRVDYQIDDGDGGVTTEERSFYVPLPDLTEEQAQIAVVSREEDVDQIGALQIQFRAPVWAWAQVNGVMATDCQMVSSTSIVAETTPSLAKAEVSKAADDDSLEYYTYMATFSNVPYTDESANDIDLDILTDMDGEYVSLLGKAITESDAGSGTTDGTGSGVGTSYFAEGGSGCSISYHTQNTAILLLMMLLSPLSVLTYKKVKY